MNDTSINLMWPFRVDGSRACCAAVDTLPCCLNCPSYCSHVILSLLSRR